MKEAFVGFDSAWSVRNLGAISYAVFQGETLERAELPQLSSFRNAAEIIKELRKECDDVLVAIDQPIIVPNQCGSRPVDSVAASLISKLGSGTQPANRDKATMFGDAAPIWKFIEDITAAKDPETTDAGICNPLMDFEAAKTATGQIHLIEVYPALALPALEPKFMARNYAARYNPRNRNKFCLADWRLVCETVRRCANEFNLQTLLEWAEEMEKSKSPSKPDQDKLDAVICLLIAIHWRRERDGHGLTVIGDLESGYMVTPASCDTRRILQEACERQNVDISPKNPA